MKNARLYETHVQSTNLERSIAFYKKLDLELAYVLNDRKAALFWIGDPSIKEFMLGVWEVAEENFRKSHFAFHVPFKELLQVPDFLKKREISLIPSFGLDTSEPVVHGWMPSACYYFLDPDGNTLEYISVLQNQPIQDAGVVHLSTWNELIKKDVL
ncbi:MAG: VOC family protein [Bacillaceae bacterium]|mgnify:FL=1|nr:VOC family protein [Bacillaceae bacterium]